MTTMHRTLALALLLTACQDGRAPFATDSLTKTSAIVSMKDAAAEVSLAPLASRARGEPAPPAAPGRLMREQAGQTRQASQTAATGMIIRNGAVTIQVDSIEPAIDRVRGIAIALGGYVGGVSINTGEHQVRSATLELKIPSARFDSAMTGMPTLGKVEHSSSSSEDVGEEFVDLTARAENAKRLEARLITLLATRTGKLDDVLKVERELARVREEIERHEGRLRFLATRVAMSTIHANVHEKMPIIAAQPGRNVLVEAFKNMWRNFVSLLTLGIEALGVVVPVALLVWAGYLVWRRWRQRRVVTAVTT